MAEKLSRNKQDRVFLHDIATPLTILKLSISKLSQTLASPDCKLTAEERANTDKLIQRALNSVKKIEELHANHRALISVRESEDAETKAS